MCLLKNALSPRNQVRQNIRLQTSGTFLHVMLETGNFLLVLFSWASEAPASESSTTCLNHHFADWVGTSGLLVYFSSSWFTQASRKHCLSVQSGCVLCSIWCCSFSWTPVHHNTSGNWSEPITHGYVCELKKKKNVFKFFFSDVFQRSAIKLLKWGRKCEQGNPECSVKATSNADHHWIDLYVFLTLSGEPMGLDKHRLCGNCSLCEEDRMPVVFYTSRHKSTPACITCPLSLVLSQSDFLLDMPQIISANEPSQSPHCGDEVRWEIPTRPSLWIVGRGNDGRFEICCRMLQVWKCVWTLDVCERTPAFLAIRWFVSLTWPKSDVGLDFLRRLWGSTHNSTWWKF